MTFEQPPTSTAGEPDRDALLRLLIANVEEYAIFLLDPQGYIVTWNIGAQRIKGYRAEEVIGKHLSIFHPEEEVRRGKAARELEVAARQGRYQEEGWRVRKDGSRFWASVVLTALYDSSGNLRGFGKVTRDLTARKRAESVELANQQLLAILDTIEDTIMVVDEQSRPVYVNAAAARRFGFESPEACLQAPFREQYDAYDAAGRLLEESERPSARALRGDEMRGEPLRLFDRERRQSTWMLVTTRKVEVGDRFYGIVVMHDVTERRQRERSERFLGDASALLAAGLDSDETLRKLAFLAVPSIADWCVVEVLGDDGRLRRVALAHADPQKLELAAELTRRYPTDPAAQYGSPRVARTGRPELYPEITDELLVGSARNAEQLRILRELELRTAIVVPLVARGRTLGTLTLIGSQPGMRFDERDLALAEELGRRAGVALDNARLYESERRAREAAERSARELAALQTISDTALSHLGLEELMRELLGRLRAILATDTATILLVDPERNDLVVRASSGLESELVAQVHVPIGRGIAGEIAASRRPKVVPDVSQAAEVWSPVLRERVRSAVGAPLVLGERVIGVLQTATVAPRDFTEREVHFLELVAHRVALALESARLYAEAQQAIRVRDEFLSIAGHELRTPLSALYLQLQSLERAVTRGADSGVRHAERVRKAAEQATRLGTLIEELLDVSRITAGRLQLDRERFDLAALAGEVAERFAEEARRAGCALEVSAESAPGCWDRNRMDQVLTNLVGNAIKYGKGKPVKVAVGRRGDWVVVAVRDEGIGVPAEHQKRIFERFERAVSERHYGGLGLGLWITRQIVEAHGGRIRVDSAPGAGSTFTVELPRGDG